MLDLTAWIFWKVRNHVPSLLVFSKYLARTGARHAEQMRRSEIRINMALTISLVRTW